MRYRSFFFVVAIHASLCLGASEAKPRTVYVAAVWASEMQEDLLLHATIVDKSSVAILQSRANL